MTRLFADTYYFLALINAKDAAHQRALQFSQSHADPILTASWILTELADGLSAAVHRAVFARILAELRSDQDTTIVPFSEALFSKGIDLYCARSDKDWSMTDCISFVVMREYGLRAALTADRHFEQAGFQILLKNY
jgi:uncharacterized protein